MTPCQRLLLITHDAQARAPAFVRAVAIARATGAALHIALFFRDAAQSPEPKSDPDHPGRGRPASPSRIREALDLEAERLRGQGLAVTTDAIDARRPAAAIQAYVRNLGPDLVIKDAERSSHLRRIALRSLDWSLLRDCPAPVLLVRANPSPLPRRIIVAVDLLQRGDDGGLNDRVIRHAAAYAQQLDAELQLAYSLNLQNPRHSSSVLHADTAEPVPDDADEMDDSLDRQLIERQAHMRREFEALARKHAIAEQQAHLLFGPPEQTLPELARAIHADVLVIGSVQHDILDRLLGRTGEYLVEKVPCDVLVVRP